MSFRRKFVPSEVTREYKKVYIIAVEGDRAEPQYFQYLKEELDTKVVEIEVLPSKSKSAPQHVFSKLRDYRIESGIKGTTELWMVIDRYQWNNLANIVEKCSKNEFGLCISNPSFEFWLLLYFEEGKGIEPAESHPDDNSSKEACVARLRDHPYLPRYTGHLSVAHREVLSKKLGVAILNAKTLDTPPCEEAYPCHKVGSTVYRLVEKLVPILENSPAMPD